MMHERVQSPDPTLSKILTKTTIFCQTINPIPKIVLHEFNNILPNLFSQNDDLWSLCYTVLKAMQSRERQLISMVLS